MIEERIPIFIDPLQYSKSQLANEIVSLRKENRQLEETNKELKSQLRRNAIAFKQCIKEYNVALGLCQRAIHTPFWRRQKVITNIHIPDFFARI